MAVGGAVTDRQQVVVSGDVTVPGQVVRVLRETERDHHTTGTLDDADGRFWGGGQRERRQDHLSKQRMDPDE